MGNTLRWWKAIGTSPKFDVHQTMRSVAYNISSLNITITGLSANHTLQVGNILLLGFNGAYKYARITSKTSTTVTMVNPGVSNGDIVDVSFSFDQADSPETGYDSLTTHVYPTYL